MDMIKLASWNMYTNPTEMRNSICVNEPLDASATAPGRQRHVDRIAHLVKH